MPLPKIESMTPQEKQDFLRSIMVEHMLTRDLVATMLKTSTARVNSWLNPIGHAGYRKMPDWAVEMLKVQLGIKPPVIAQTRQRSRGVARSA